MLDVPKDELLFPCLKKIELVPVVYSGDHALVNLVSGCPVLEELFVERQVIGKSDKLGTFNVCSDSLRRLRISFALCVVGDYKVVIDAPRLEYLYILDVISTDYSLTKPPSLDEAHIKTRTDSHTESALSYVHGLNMPVFPNLVKFVVGIDVIWGWNLLPILLQNMPNLEHITFSDGLVPFPRSQHIFNISWNPPAEPPACLWFKMKEIIIENGETITQEEFILISYLLKHSEVLGMFAINSHKIERKRRAHLFNFPCSKCVD